MSTYCYMSGKIVCEDKEALDQVKKILEDGKWVKAGFWQDEVGRSGEQAYNDKELTVEIPYGNYRNLINVTEQLAKHGKLIGRWATTDGIFMGGDLGGKTEDLNHWASDVDCDPHPLGSDYGDNDEFEIAVSEWQDDIASLYVAE